PRGERIRLRGERTDGAEIDDIARQLGGHGLFEIGRDLHVLAAAGRAQFLHARYFSRETDAARAVNAPRHESLDQRPHIFLGNRALVLLIAAMVAAIGHGLVLQVAFAALVADRTV